MDKQLFTEYSEEERLQMLKDNCNRLLEDYGYDKPLSKDQLKAIKDKLSSASISLHDVQEEKKQADSEYNEQIKNLKGTIAEQVKQLKTRTTYTCELCFEVIDYDEKKVGVYNKDGILVEERVASLKELSEPRNMFAKDLKKTGTND
jgi:hypothetical protein